MDRRTPVFIVCSPLPRVGKTLLAQLLVEFFVADGRPVAAFDLNPDGYSLAAQLPDYTSVANIGGTKGQMALFDQLIVPDEVAKIVDVGYGCFEQFVTVMHDIGFVVEARRRFIAPTVLFVAEPDHRSIRAYGKLRQRIPDLPLVPVFNAGTGMDARASNASRGDFPGGPLHIPALSPGLRNAISQVGFSAALVDGRRTRSEDELRGWVRNIFLQFRELELRLLLDDLKPTFADARLTGKPCRYVR
jgi:hypothetical protein